MTVPSSLLMYSAPTALVKYECPARFHFAAYASEASQHEASMNERRRGCILGYRRDPAEVAGSPFRGCRIRYRLQASA